MSNQDQKSSKFVPVRFQDKDGNWRVVIRSSRTKFDDDAKQRFLEVYRENARMGDACAAAGVTPKTVRWHLNQDPDFGEACLAAEEEYKARLLAHHQKLVFDGTIKKTYDRSGGLVSEETVYPIRLIELELKKHDEGYREKREVDLTVSGGVMVAPKEAESIDDWERRFGGDGKTIDGEATEVEVSSPSSGQDDEG